MNYSELQDKAKRAVRDLRATPSGWARGRCPFCLGRVGSPDHRGSLAHWVAKGFVRCFRCGIKVWFEGYQPGDATQDEPRDTYKSRGAPPWYWPLWGETALGSQAFAAGIAYAESRGFDVAIRRACGMGAAVSGEYPERLIVPHRDSRGDWWGFSARSWVTGAAMPHVYPKSMNRSNLFNEAALYESTDDPVLLEEGVLDGLLYWPDCVCSLGKPMRDHIPLLKKAKRPIAVVLDGDAWREGEAFAQVLRFEGLRAGTVRLPPGRDPNEFHVVSPADIRRAATDCLGSLGPVRVSETCQNY